MAYDLNIQPGGDIDARTEHTTGVDLILQRVRIRLRIFAGEYFLDRRKGLPYLEWKQDKAQDLDLIRVRIFNEIRSTPGVIDVPELDVARSGAALSISGTVTIEDEGQRLKAELGEQDGNTTPALTILLDG